MEDINRSIINIAVPLGVLSLTLIISFWLLRASLSRIRNWLKKQTWPADTIIYGAIKQVLFSSCLLLSAFFALLTSSISVEWKSTLGDSLWTLLIVVVLLATLEGLRGLVGYFSRDLGLPRAASTIQIILSVVLIIVTGLLVLGIWGAPTIPIILFIGVGALLILIAVRDTAPNYFAAFQLAIWEHIQIGDTIRLHNGTQGKVTKLGWHNLELRTTGNDILFIPNSQITRQIITKLGDNPGSPSEIVEIIEVQPTVVGSPTDEDITLNDIDLPLSKRELEIARLVSHGATNKELASKLGMAENTAKVHIKNILLKLGLKNRQQLAVLAAAHSKNQRSPETPQPLS